MKVLHRNGDIYWKNLLWLLETEDVYAELRAEDVYREMVEKIQKELEKSR